MTNAIMKRLIHRWRQLHLYIQLAILSALVVSSSIICLSIIIANKQIASVYQRIESNAQALVQNVTLTSVSHIINNELDALEELLLKSAEFPGVVYLNIYDKNLSALAIIHTTNGKPAISYDSASFKLPNYIFDTKTQQSIKHKDSIEFIQPIKSNHIIGLLHAEFDAQDVIALRKAIWRDTIIVTVVIVLFNLLSLGLILLTPLRTIKKASQFALQLDKNKGTQLDIKAGSRELSNLNTRS